MKKIGFVVVLFVLVLFSFGYAKQNVLSSSVQKVQKSQNKVVSSKTTTGGILTGQVQKKQQIKISSGCQLSSEKLLVLQKKQENLKKIEANLVQIVQLAQKVGYNTKLLVQYEQQIVQMQQILKSVTCDLSGVEKTSDTLKPLIAAIQKEFENIKKFTNKKK